MKHMERMDIRPDVITRTGVIQPYAVRRVSPMQAAQFTVHRFEDTARPSGPRISSEMQPEEFAARAKRVAVALAAGKRMPVGSDPKLMAAAKLLMEGKPFTINSAGRSAYVEASPTGLGRASQLRGSYWNLYRRG